jgi:hypothetical protein
MNNRYDFIFTRNTGNISVDSGDIGPLKWCLESIF